MPTPACLLVSYCASSRGFPSADESATRGVSPPGAPLISPSTVKIHTVIPKRGVLGAGARTPPREELRGHTYTHKTQEEGGPGHPDAAVQSGAAKPWIAGAAPIDALAVKGTWT